MNNVIHARLPIRKPSVEAGLTDLICRAILKEVTRNFNPHEFQDNGGVQGVVIAAMNTLGMTRDDHPFAFDLVQHKAQEPVKSWARNYSAWFVPMEL